MINEWIINLDRISKIKHGILESSQTIKKSVSLAGYVDKAIVNIIKCIKSGNKIILFGNGGSAADSQHMAAEMIGRFKIDRRSYPAISLTTDSSVITSLSNDYSFNIVFSRQCECLVKPDDVVIGISTSGNSKNVKKGLLAAKKLGAVTIGLLGNKGGQIAKIVDIPIIVNSSSTPRIQEVHRTLSHIICDIVEKELVEGSHRIDLD